VDLLRQVDHAIDIFEGKTNGNSQGLFLFDNAPSHQKRAADALSAKKMPKGISALFHFHGADNLLCSSQGQLEQL
jgi:hypothetical protein